MQRLLKKTIPISSEESVSGKIAYVISLITNPLFVAMPTFLLISLRTAPDVAHAFLWWGVIVVGISLAPLMFIWRGVQKGRYADQHLSVREQRIVPLLFGLVCAASVFFVLFKLNASLDLIATITAIFIGGIITLIITRFWKISMHVVGIAGSTTVLSLVYGPIFLLLSPLVVLVGWARWRLHAHTVLQGIAGTFLALVVTIAIFGFFHLL